MDQCATTGLMLRNGVDVKGICGKCGETARHDLEADIRENGPDRTMINVVCECWKPNCDGKVTFLVARTKHSPYVPLLDDNRPGGEFYDKPQTISDIIDQRYALTIKCLDCRRLVHCPGVLIDEKIPRHSLIENVAKFYVCSACKSKNVKTGFHDPIC